MSAQYEVDLEVALEGTKVDVGEAVHCAGCDGRFHEGVPVTVVARTCSSGWDIKIIYGPHCAPDELEADRRDGEGIALVEAELVIVMGRQQAWMALTHVDVLEWISPKE